MVQVDETKLNYNVKGHRGRSIDPCWALCNVETSFVPALEYCCLIENRSTNILIEIINNVVLPNSIIHTDEWAAYIELRNSENYEYKKGCHKYNFVNPSDGTHIQHAESFNNILN